MNPDLNPDRPTGAAAGPAPADPAPAPPGRSPADDALAAGVRRHQQRARQAARAGEPSLMGQLATVGVLGWIVVLPTLLGLLGGRWLDGQLHGGHTATGAGLVLGLALGCWSAWRWMHGR